MTDTTRARTFAPDPQCVICDGLGVRHGKPKRVGMHVRRDPCPCTILGPLQVRDDRSEAALDLVLTGRCVLRIPDAVIDHSDDGVVASYHITRTTSELPPIKDTAVLDAYPDCQPRTPIDPVARILSPGLQRGNADLPPSVRGQVSAYRDCSICGGRGVLCSTSWVSKNGAKQCQGCNGAGRVKL